MKINFKLLVIVLEISLIPLFFLGFVAYSYSKNEITKSVVNELEAVSQIQKNRLQDNINSSNQLLDLFCTKPQLRLYLSAFNDNPTKELQKNINDNILEAKGNSAYIKKILIANPTGIIVASTNPDLIGNDVSAEIFFKQGIQHNDVSFMVKDAVTGEINRYLVGPLALNGKTIGMAILVASNDEINFLVNDYTGLGNTGETLLVTNDGNGNALFLAPTRFDKNAALTRTVAKSNLKVASVHAILGEEQTFLNAVDYKGAEVLAVTHYIPSVGWGMVVLIDKAEALLPIKKLQELLLFICLLSALLIFFISYAIAISITGPLVSLKQMANKIAAGDMSQYIEVSTSDEIGDLALSFNRMVLKLTASYGEMEQKISRRTKDLLKEVSELEGAKNLIASQKAKDEAILGSMGEGVVVADKSGKLIYFNKTAREILGVEIEVNSDDQLSKTFGLVDLKTRKPFHILKFPLVRALNGETVDKIEMLAQRSVNNNKDIVISANGRPVSAPDGTIIGAVMTFGDISKEKEVDKAKTEFVSLASHQLRTPLSTISWYTEMLLDGDAGKLKPEQREFLDFIYEGNQRMVALVNSLLNVSRIDLGTFAVDPEAVNMAEISDSVLTELKRQVLAKHLKVVKKYEQALPSLQADPRLMRIIIQNLFSNAVKYTPEKGSITVTLAKDKRNILFSIQDTGCGIPKAQQGQIFSKLFRAENAKEIDNDGSGLGLYLAKSIVDNIDGKIWFVSGENKGSTFYVTIPLSGMKKKEGAKTLDVEYK